MRRTLIGLTLTLALGSVALCEEPVARVQSINPADGSGKAVLRQQHATDKESFPVSVNATGYLKDHFSTDSNTLAALEFLIGGRVGINKDTDIEIVNERSVADGKTDVKRVILKNGSLWVKADAKALKQPLEIQTNGGVMGIKGTEFTVDQQPDGTIRLCCFESNSELGGVEVRDTQGSVVGIARPGDEYRIGLNMAPLIRHFDDIRQFRESILNDRVFRDIHQSLYYTRKFLGELGSYPPIEAARSFQYANMAQNIQRNPGLAWAQRAKDLRPQMLALGDSLRGQLGKAPRQAAIAVNFPSQMSPDSSQPTTQTRQTGAFPDFSWQGVEGADGYAVLLARDENFQEVVYTERVKLGSLSYPREMRPLDAGTYYWRVVPVDAEDRPVQQASQTYFVVTP